MNLFGSIRELVAAVFRKNSQAITLRPNQTTTYTASRDVQLPQVDTDEIIVGRTSADQSANRLKNKHLDDASVIVVDTTDTTKQIKFDAGGTTGTSTTLTGAQTANRVLTLPDVTDTLTANAATQTLSGKTLTTPTINNQVANYIDVTEAAAPGTPAASTLRIYSKTDNKLYKKDPSGVELEVGSGSGTGEINYISNSDFETGLTTGWATYNDGAVAVPVDGTGGSVTGLTTAANSTAPLRGVYDLKLSKDAANRQGEGWSYDIQVKDADRSRKLKWQFNLRTSANFVAGDIVLYAYDKDGSVLITPSVTSLPKANATGAALDWVISFDTTANDDFRIIFHIATTNASAYDIFIDNIVVGPDKIIQGAAISEWISYTPTTAGMGTLASSTVYYRRVGSSIEVNGFIDAGTPTAVAIKIGLPTGLTVNTSVLPVFRKNTVGEFHISNAGGGGGVYTNSIGNVIGVDPADNTSVTVHQLNDSDASGFNYQTLLANALFNAGAQLSFFFAVPVNEWAGSGTVNLGANDIEYASNSSTGDTDDTSSFQYGPAGNTFPGALSTNRSKRVRFQTPVQITDRVWLEYRRTTTANWVAVTGDAVSGAGPFQYQGTNTYGIGISIAAPATNTDVDVIFGRSMYPSSATYTANGAAWSTAEGYWRLCKARAGGAAGFAIATSTASGLVSTLDQTFGGRKSAGNSKVRVHRNGSGQSIAAATPTKVQFTTESYDTNSEFDNATNYRFTPTRAGYYYVSASTSFPTVSTTDSGSNYQLRIMKNSTIDTTVVQTPVQDNTDGGTNQYRLNAVTIGASNLIFLNGTTDYIELFVYQDTGASRSITGDPESTYLSIVEML